MRNEWILDVLADLQTFARDNGLSALAEQMNETRLVAATELALTGEGQSENECGATRSVGGIAGGCRTGL